MNHRRVKTVQIRKVEIGIIHELPLATGVFVTPTVAFAREIDPLRMTELIAHERQVAAIDGGCRYQTDHLMKRNAAIYHIRRMAVLEMPVHVGVHEAEDDGLVANQRLIMALCVRDRLLVFAPVRHLEQNMPGFPILVFLLFDILDPEIRNTHRQTIIEAHTAVFYLRCQARHAAHLFRNSDCIRLHLMDHFVR